MQIVPASAHYLQRAGSGSFPHITYDEVQKMMGQAATEQTRLLVKTLWFTGARISEILAIRADDLVAEKTVVKIRRLKRRKPFEQEVPVPPDLFNELRLFARAKKRKGRIFAANRISAWDAVRRLGMKALGRPIAPKFSRHGRSYDMVKRNVHPLLGARALGHANVSSFMSYYHPTEEDIRGAFGV